VILNFSKSWERSTAVIKKKHNRIIFSEINTWLLDMVTYRVKKERAQDVEHFREKKRQRN